MLEQGNYNIEEEEAIDKLKQKVEHKLIPKLLEDETFYRRFLKARNFDLNQAEAMILKHLSDINHFEFLKDTYKPPEFLSKYLPLSFLGFDKEGSVVLYIDYGKIDVRGILPYFSFKEVAQYYAYFYEKNYERLKEQSIKLGRSLTKLSMIINFDQLSLSTITYKRGIEFAIRGTILFQDNFPERVISVYAINCPIYFTMAFPLVKPFVASSLLQKTKYFGKDGWRESLLEIIDPDVLPAFLGGNRTDPDGNPQCQTFIIHGKKVTEEDKESQLKEK